MLVKAIVEIPKNSTFKYEIKNDIKDLFANPFETPNKILVVDRVLNQKIPANYGYIENTISDDGDALDVFIVANEPLQPLSQVLVQIVAGFRCIDNGISDDKLLAIVHGDEVTFDPNDIKRYLETYKEGFKVLEFVGESEAAEIVLKNGK